MGHPRTPTALKIIRGNPGKRPLPTDEPKAKVEKLKPPAHLKGLARSKFLALAKEFHKLNMTSAIDSDALVAFSVQYQLWREMMDDVNANGFRIEFEKTYHNRDGSINYTETITKINPSVQAADKALTQMRQLMGEFGMTPASRSKVTVAGGLKDELDDVFD